jgi:hypothetical protein
MEMSQETSLFSYLFLKQAKMPGFSFYLFSFFIYKIEEQEGETTPAQEEGLAQMREGRYWGKGVGG